MKFIALQNLSYDQITALAFKLGVQVRGRRDYTKTWVNAVRKEMIRRAVNGINCTGDFVVAAANFAIDAATSQKAKQLYKHLGALISAIAAILWWIATFVWDGLDEALGHLIVDRCLEQPETVTPPADTAPIKPIIPALRKLNRVVKQHWLDLGELVSDMQTIIKSRGGVAIALATSLIP